MFRFQNIFLFVWKVDICYPNVGYIYSEIKAIYIQTYAMIMKLIF